jgi:hypothetical protein
MGDALAQHIMLMRGAEAIAFTDAAGRNNGLRHTKYYTGTSCVFAMIASGRAGLMSDRVASRPRALYHWREERREQTRSFDTQVVTIDIEQFVVALDTINTF